MKIQVVLMWEDNDFYTVGLDPHCLPLDIVSVEEDIRIVKG